MSTCTDYEFQIFGNQEELSQAVTALQGCVSRFPLDQNRMHDFDELPMVSPHANSVQFNFFTERHVVSDGIISSLKEFSRQCPEATVKYVESSDDGDLYSILGEIKQGADEVLNEWAAPFDMEAALLANEIEYQPTVNSIVAVATLIQKRINAIFESSEASIVIALSLLLIEALKPEFQNDECVQNALQVLLPKIEVLRKSIEEFEDDGEDFDDVEELMSGFEKIALGFLIPENNQQALMKDRRNQQI